jgi:hypothetical protein
MDHDSRKSLSALAKVVLSGEDREIAREERVVE